MMLKRVDRAIPTEALLQLGVTQTTEHPPATLPWEYIRKVPALGTLQLLNDEPQLLPSAVYARVNPHFWSLGVAVRPA